MPSKKVMKIKQAQVAELAEKIKKAKIIALVDYRGITVEEDTTLRKDLREIGADYLVTKNSIIKFAAEAAGIKGFEDMLEGPSAIVLGYEDYVDAPKAIYTFGEGKKYYNIKGGAMDGKAVTSAEVIKLASLPSREVLLSMLASALIGNIRNLAVVLDQTKEKMQENA
ncbi:MAG: 50S ribosomal protein L10 [Clostridia bacterium]